MAEILSGGYAGNWPSTNVTLLRRLRNSNSSADWDEFCQVYSPLIYSFCVRRQVQHDDALDVRQNVLMSLQKGVASFDPAKGKFRGWFGMMIRREIFKHRQRAARQGLQIAEDFDFGETVNEDDQEWDAEFNRYVIEMAVNRIRFEFGELEWRVMEHVVLKNCKPRTIVDEIGRDAAWISRVKYRLIQRLKAEVRFLTEANPE